MMKHNECPDGALARELPGSRALVCDITSEESVQEMFSGLTKLDILVNNAATNVAQGTASRSMTCSSTS